MNERRTAKRERFALDVANAIMDSPRFRQVVKEVVLRVLVTQDDLRAAGVVRSWLAACDAAGVRFSVGDDGHLRCTNRDRLTLDLRGVLTLNRENIVAHLTKIRDLEKLQVAREAAEAKRNEAALKRDHAARQTGSNNGVQK